MPKGTPEGAKRPSAGGGASGARAAGGGASSSRPYGSGYSRPGSAAARRVTSEGKANRNTVITSARSVPRSVERWNGSNAQKGVIQMYLNGNTTQKAAAERIMRRWITD
jgi:hypothetical protein